MASENSPEALKQFAQQLTSGVPGGAVLGPVGEVAPFIVSQVGDGSPKGSAEQETTEELEDHVFGNAPASRVTSPHDARAA